MRTRSEVAGGAFALMVVSGGLLGITRAVDPFLVVFIPVVIGVAVFCAAPHTFWLRADDSGITLVKRLVPRRYAWVDVHGLAMEFAQEEDGDGRHLTLRLRLTEPKGRFWGPFLCRVPVTEEDTPSGVPPLALAELFAVFGEQRLPVEKPEFANEVLRVRGLPKLPPWAPWAVPAEGPPAPEKAYADAPDLASEEREVEALSARARRRVPARREYLLRRAALADRRCLRDGGERGRFGAVAAAEELVEIDQIRVEGDPRPYVRRQYLIWRASGR
ncbi:hypothetical protein [Streptomyces sp. NRRL WC-3742]|uniref:hypothetical protein n=1 Tax=Streptomyces sp. NRRL WC-3742 TaxID=1463934 RepID=UPI00131D9931|nr:hypothetical protein [Streptomyces sp. NRRL WC-3742]